MAFQGGGGRDHYPSDFYRSDEWEPHNVQAYGDEKTTNKGHQAYFHHPQRSTSPHYIPPPVVQAAAPDGLTVDHLPTADLKLLVQNRGISPEGLSREELIQRLKEKMIKEEMPTDLLWTGGRGQSTRRGACVVAYKGCIYEFGGLDPHNEDHNSLHKWTPGAASFEEVQAKGRLPPARWTAAAVVHRDCMYVFGGFFGYAGLAKPNGRLNDLWRFDFSTGWWTQLGAYGDLPCARSHHSMTVVNDSVLLFGGVDEKERKLGGYGMFDSELRTEYENVHLNDVHVLDLRTLNWTRLNLLGAGPFGGLKATSTVWRGCLYAMGWRQEGGVVTDMPGRPKATTYTFEMWRLALTNTGAGWETAPLAWEKVLMTGTAPTPRDNFSQCLIGDRWLLHGGNDVFRELKNDTFQFDFHTAAWGVVNAKSASPQVPDVRYSHRAVAMNGNMYVVGGINQFASPNRGGTLERCAAVEELLLRTSTDGSFPAEHSSGVAKANSAMDSIAAMRGELMQGAEAGVQVRPNIHPTPVCLEREYRLADVPTHPANLPRPGEAPPAAARQLHLRIMAACGSSQMSEGAAAAPGPPPAAMPRSSINNNTRPTPPNTSTTTMALPHSTGLQSAASDVTILCGGMRVQAHSSVLTAQSSRFAAMLSMTPKQTALANLPMRHVSRIKALKPLVMIVQCLYVILVHAVFAVMALLPPPKGRLLRVRDLPFPVLLVLLQYMYNCLNEMDEDMLMDMFKASIVYGIPALHDDCARHLMELLDVTTVVRFTHLAEECNDIMLYGTCVRFAAQHWDAVAASAPFANLCKLFPLEAKKLSHDVQALACTRNDENPNSSHSQTDFPDAQSQ